MTSKLCSEFHRTPIPSTSRSFAAAYIRKTESLSGKRLPTPYEIISHTYRNSASCVLTEPCGGSQLTEAFYYTVNGRAKRMLGIAVDITERKRSEEKLRESEERLAGIVSSAMDAIIVIDEEQRIVLFNTAAEKMFRCKADEVIETTVDRLIPQRFRHEHTGNILHFAESGVTNRKMDGSWALRATGEEFPIDASISQIETVGKKLFTIIIRDVTESRRAQEAIRESEERFRLVANTAPVLIWMSGPDKLCNYLQSALAGFHRPVR